MTDRIDITARCLLVGEYVDEGELPTNGAVHSGEPVRAHIVASYLDHWSKDDGFKEFTVLLKDGRIAAVRGQGLRFLPNSETGEGLFYGIITRTAPEEVFVALFKSSEVVGIFHGDINLDEKNVQ